MKKISDICVKQMLIFHDFSQEFAWNKLSGALVLVESVHGLVQDPPADISEAKDMAKVCITKKFKSAQNIKTQYRNIFFFQDALIDLTYKSTEKMLGPLFPLFILLNLSLKLQLVRTKLFIIRFV